MRVTPLYLAIDFGSQSVRAVIFDNNGNVILKHQSYPLQYLHPEQGFVEQQPVWFYQQVAICCQNLQQLAFADNIDLTELRSMGITTMRNTLFNLDAKGQPLRNAIVWLDQRKATNMPKLHWSWRLLFNAANVLKPVLATINTLQSEAFINYIAQHDRHNWQKTEHLLLLSGYLTFRLTNNYVDSSANIISHLPFDFKQQQWHKPTSWQFQALAVKANWLPKLLKTGGKLGQLTASAQQDLQIANSLPVIAVGSDKACEVLGAGCYRAGQLHISLGTAISVTLLNKTFKGPKAFYPAYPSLVTGLYLTEVMLPHGLNVLSEFIRRNATALQFLTDTNLQTRNIEHLIELYIAANNVTATNLVFELTKFDNVSNYHQGFINLSNHSIFEQYVAIQESVVNSLNTAIKQLLKRVHRNVNKLVITGGGANSRRLLQAIADKTQRFVDKPEVLDAGALGVAITLAVQDKQYSSIAEAVKCMGAKTTVFTPVNNYPGDN
ncbi:FGGY family carbohydrate kinase [Thalassotalea sp. ND16A]|uniref:FGGY family carbohydrate kinase n=1 Tax=Thalassotalea sp. ND16A TaxID=1535422 RepID=UPI00051CF64F|nr:FGGY family carbohydrate kinase [Thalassotalea sp. ND16A]KGJ99647.1 Xylulokinase [Thalassotalea sp. ND16A]